MKIERMTTRDLLDRMGSETTDAEAKAMWELINAGGWSDTDEISDTRWIELIAEALENVKLYRASISDGMSRNAGGERLLTAADEDEAWSEAAEWTRAGIYSGPSQVVFYLDRRTEKGWIEVGKRSVEVE